MLESATNRPLPVLINPDIPIQGKAFDAEQFKCCSYMAMEFADKGNLFDYVCHKPISENATCFYIR
jgi:serine/threonine protein kinase